MDRETRMSMEAIETRQVENHTIHIVQDENPQNPRDDENLGKILYTSSRYVLGDKQVSSDEIEEITKRDDVIWLPVYAYIHSGVVLSTGAFGDRFDSGQCGIIYCTREAAKEYSQSEDAISELLKMEVDIFSKFLSGEVYGFVLEDEDGIEIDSCYGFYDIEGAVSEASECIPISHWTPVNPELYNSAVDGVVKGPVSSQEDLDRIYIGTLFRDNRNPLDLYASDSGYYWCDGKCMVQTTGRKVKELQVKYTKNFSGGSFKYRISQERAG